MIRIAVDKTYIDRREPLIVSVETDKPGEMVHLYMIAGDGIPDIVFPDYELASDYTDANGRAVFSVQWENSGNKILQAAVGSWWNPEASNKSNIIVDDKIYDDSEWAAEGSPYQSQITVPDKDTTTTAQHWFITEPAVETAGSVFQTGANVAGAAEGASGAAAEGITDAMAYLKYALIAVMLILVISVALNVMPAAIGKRAVKA